MYDNYVFDLYGTLVDIHTEENDARVWEKLSLFYGFYGALYDPQELQESYLALIQSKETDLKGETIELDTESADSVDSGMELKNGYVLVCVDGYPLGWAKNNRGVLKNKYLSGWRMMS